MRIVCSFFPIILLTSSSLPLEILLRIGSFASDETLRDLLLVGGVGGVVARHFLLHKLELSRQELRIFKETFRKEDIVDSLRHLTLVDNAGVSPQWESLTEELGWIADWCHLHCFQIHGFVLDAAMMEVALKSLRVLRCIGLSHTRLNGRFKPDLELPQLEELNLYSVEDDLSEFLRQLPNIRTLRTDAHLGNSTPEMPSLTSITVDYGPHNQGYRFTPLDVALSRIGNPNQIEELAIDSCDPLDPGVLIDLPNLKRYRGDVVNFERLIHTTNIDKVELSCSMFDIDALGMALDGLSLDQLTLVVGRGHLSNPTAPYQLLKRALSSVKCAKSVYMVIANHRSQEDQVRYSSLSSRKSR